jgi:predicted GNAT family N-acyltransferase
MANKRIGIARWCQELQEEEHGSIGKLVQALHIRMNNLSTQMLTTMELLVEQRQGQQQLQDEVADHQV